MTVTQHLNLQKIFLPSMPQSCFALNHVIRLSDAGAELLKVIEEEWVT